LNNPFSISTWDEYHKAMDLPPVGCMRVGDGMWSDGALLIQECVLARRPCDDDAEIIIMSYESYASFWHPYQLLLPRGNPAIHCRIEVDEYPESPSSRTAILFDQRGNSFPVGYGYLSMLRNNCPGMAFYIVPPYLIPPKATPAILLVDQSGSMIGLLAGLRLIDPTGECGEPV
jgi:hypothetical protein